MSTAEIHTVDSAYMIEFEHVPDGFRVKDLSGDTSPHTYTPPYSAYLYYYTTYGVWKYTTGNGKWEFSSQKSGINYRPTIIRECGTPGMKGKHYDAIIEDDMVDAAIYGINKEYLKALKKGTSVERGIPLVAAKRRRQGIITNITEGGNEMTKQLYHVILFNRKTEEIDFKEYIPAKDVEAAAMTAAQRYGKYDADIHAVIVKYIEDSDYEAIK